MASDIERGPYAIAQHREDEVGNDESHNAWNGKEETENVPGVL